MKGQINKLIVTLPVNSIPLITENKVLYSILHKLEHMYIRFLKREIEYARDICAQTDKNNMSIFVFIYAKDLIYIEEENIVESLQNMKLDQSEICNEDIILDNEIQLLRELTRMNLSLYSEETNFNLDEINEVHCNGIDWINAEIQCVCIEIQNISKEFDRTNSIVEKDRVKLVQNFYKSRGQFCHISEEEKSHENQRILLCFPIARNTHKGKKIARDIFDRLSGNRGFFRRYFNLDNFITNIAIPSIEIKGTLIWITLYTYVKVKQLSDIQDALYQDILRCIDMEEDKRNILLLEKYEIYLEQENYERS